MESFLEKKNEMSPASFPLQILFLLSCKPLPRKAEKRLERDRKFNAFFFSGK